jgi:hypothetical protein
MERPRATSPSGNFVEFVMNRDGSDLRSVPPPVAVRGGRLVPTFEVTGGGAHRRADLLSVPGTAVNPAAAASGYSISEVFFIDGRSVLQLTNFGRVDTGTPSLTPDGRYVIFSASADPFRSNPTVTCQLFSVDPLGSDLRQLTHFTASSWGTHGASLGTRRPCGGYLRREHPRSEFARNSWPCSISHQHAIAHAPATDRVRLEHRPDASGADSLFSAGITSAV